MNRKLEPRATAENKRLITADWASGFPGLTIGKPMWLMRRCGPIIAGIFLERDSSNDQYRPSFFIDCLGRGGTMIDGLSLGQPLLTVRTSYPEWIRIRFHYDHVPEAVDRMRGQIVFPIEGTIHLSDVVRHYHDYALRGTYALERFIYNPGTYEQLFVYYTWCGLVERAESILYAVDDMSRQWDPRLTEVYGGQPNWIGRWRTLIHDPLGVRQAVADDVARFKLAKIADTELECDDADHLPLIAVCAEPEASHRARLAARLTFGRLRPA